MKFYRNLALLTLADMVLAAPAKVSACAACYGANIDDRMADGMNWAILTLGVIIATVLGAFLAFLIRVIRKSEALEAAAQNQPSHGLSNLRSSRGDEAQTEGENTEPPYVGCYGLKIGSAEPSKI